MANNFKGYLLKFGDVELPNSYLQMDRCTSIPKQREEIEAYRDDYSRDLIRVTAAGKKTKQVFFFRPLTHLQIQALRAVMEHSLVNAAQRKYHITYWDDESMDYDEGDFYIPDITFTRSRVDEVHNLVYYSEFEMHIIEY